MRAMQDYYLRTLNHIANKGHYEFLSTYLHPEYANYAIRFIGLDPSNLTFEKVEKRYQPTNGSRSLAARSVRIAYEELAEYCSKPTAKRKSIILKTIDQFVLEDDDKLDAVLKDYPLSDFDYTISINLGPDKSLDEKDNAIQIAIERQDFGNRHHHYDHLKKYFEELVSARGEQLAEMCIEEIN